MLLELGNVSTEFHAVDLLSVLVISTPVSVRRRDCNESIRPVIHALGDPGLAVLAVSDAIEHRTHWPIHPKREKEA